MSHAVRTLAVAMIAALTLAGCQADEPVDPDSAWNHPDPTAASYRALEQQRDLKRGGVYRRAPVQNPEPGSTGNR